MKLESQPALWNNTGQIQTCSVLEELAGVWNWVHSGTTRMVLLVSTA